MMPPSPLVSICPCTKVSLTFLYSRELGYERISYSWARGPIDESTALRTWYNHNTAYICKLQAIR